MLHCALRSWLRDVYNKINGFSLSLLTAVNKYQRNHCGHDEHKNNDLICPHKYSSSLAQSELRFDPADGIKFGELKKVGNAGAHFDGRSEKDGHRIAPRQVGLPR